MAGKGKRPERGVDWKKYYDNASKIKWPKKKKANEN